VFTNKCIQIKWLIKKRLTDQLNKNAVCHISNVQEVYRDWIKLTSIATQSQSRQYRNGTMTSSRKHCSTPTPSSVSLLTCLTSLSFVYLHNSHNSRIKKFLLTIKQVNQIICFKEKCAWRYLVNTFYCLLLIFILTNCLQMQALNSSMSNVFLSMWATLRFVQHFHFMLITEHSIKVKEIYRNNN